MKSSIFIHTYLFFDPLYTELKYVTNVSVKKIKIHAKQYLSRINRIIFVTYFVINL